MTLHLKIPELGWGDQTGKKEILLNYSRSAAYSRFPTYSEMQMELQEASAL